jgi:hypothetical protein
MNLRSNIDRMQLEGSLLFHGGISPDGCTLPSTEISIAKSGHGVVTLLRAIQDIIGMTLQIGHEFLWETHSVS